MQNLLQFDADLLLQADYHLKSKARSLDFGRYLYQMSLPHQVLIEPVFFWLKAQNMQPDGFIHAQDGFKHELLLYQQWSEQQLNFLLPYQVLSIALLPLELVSVQLHPQALLLPHAQSMFEQNPNLMTFSQISFLMMQAVNVLDELAQLGWMHADLKAEHFVQYDSQIKLIDFEQAMPISSTHAAAMNATPRYMAPELFHGEKKSLQSDIYALGIVLLEWLTGQRLQAKTYEDWAYLHCQWLIIDLPQQFKTFEPLLKRMLARQKTLRLSDFSQIKMRLMTEIV